MKIKIADLEKLVSTALQKKYNKKISEQISDVIMFGELSGKKSHGIVRLMTGGSSMLAQKPPGKPVVKDKTKVSKLINGNRNPGMLVGSMAMKEVINLAKENGFGIVGTNNTYSTSGCLSYYLEKIGRENLIGIIMARSPLCMAPFNSKEPLFGTNPIGFVIPTGDAPIIFDMGTSAISWGALLKADSADEKIPNNTAIDSDGNVTENPKEAMKGAVLGFDNSYKSSGLSMIVEILSGVLPGAGFIDINKDNGWGNTFIAFQPDLLIEFNEFSKDMDRFIERVKKSESKDGKVIRISGESTLRNRDDALSSGEVDVSEKIVDEIKEFING